MKIFRNREFINSVILWLILTIFMLFIFCNHNILIVIILESMIFLFIFIIFQLKRYHEIQNLSKYLQQVYDGKEVLDIRDYKEGELSILKSDIYKLMVILKQQKEIVEKDKIFLSQSLNNVSHQLKTPLTSMMILNDIMMKQDVSKDQQRIFQIQIRHQLQRMEWLIITLLKLAKIDAETVVFDKKTCLLNEVFNEVIEPLRVSMELKNINYQIKCSDDIKLYMDKQWIKEAFTNILKNCIEHSNNDGKIEISCEEYPFQVRITIKDNGCGIIKEDLPHIFERFYKGKNTNKNSVGIGLALTKSILDQHHATIEAASKINQGTCFYICFYK